MNISEKHKLGDLLYSDTYGLGYITRIVAIGQIDTKYLCEWIEPNFSGGIAECYRDAYSVSMYKQRLEEMLEYGV